jgi:hypothetical protein
MQQLTVICFCLCDCNSYINYKFYKYIFIKVLQVLVQKVSVLCRNWVWNLGTQLALASRPSSSRSVILALAIKGWGQKTRVVLLPPPTLVGILKGCSGMQEHNGTLATLH